MEINTLFETPDLLVINKPAGLLVHPDGKQEKNTLVDWILETYPEIRGVGESMKVVSSQLEVGSEENIFNETDLKPKTLNFKLIDRPGIVHRLDEETSGAMLIAKNQKTFLFLKEQFQNHAIGKEYHAFVWGGFKESEGMVDIPIGRNKNDFRRWHAGRGTRGELREAQTRWQVAGTVSENEELFSFMHLFPKTGRTHQLRVHMKYLQHPIVSDDLYAPTKPVALGFDRVALHARSITFSLSDGEKKTVTAPYPEDFIRAIKLIINDQ